jgi:hypothetical protein
VTSQHTAAVCSSAAAVSLVGDYVVERYRSQPFEAPTTLDIDIEGSPSALTVTPTGKVLLLRQRYRRWSVEEGNLVERLDGSFAVAVDRDPNEELLLMPRGDGIAVQRANRRKSRPVVILQRSATALCRIAEDCSGAPGTVCSNRGVAFAPTTCTGFEVGGVVPADEFLGTYTLAEYRHRPFDWDVDSMPDERRDAPLSQSPAMLTLRAGGEYTAVEWVHDKRGRSLTAWVAGFYDVTGGSDGPTLMLGHGLARTRIGIQEEGLKARTFRLKRLNGGIELEQSGRSIRLFRTARTALCETTADCAAIFRRPDRWACQAALNGSWCMKVDHVRRSSRLVAAADRAEWVGSYYATPAGVEDSPIEMGRLRFRQGNRSEVAAMLTLLPDGRFYLAQAGEDFDWQAPQEGTFVVEGEGSLALDGRYGKFHVQRRCGKGLELLGINSGRGAQQSMRLLLTATDRTGLCVSQLDCAANSRTAPYARWTCLSDTGLCLDATRDSVADLVSTPGAVRCEP